ETSDTGEPGYLDKPRTGGGGGRKTHTLNGQHAPSVTRVSDGVYSVGGSKLLVKGDPAYVGKTVTTLSDLYNTPTGKNVMDSINNGKHTTTIQDLDVATAKKNGALNTPSDAAGSVTPGKGSDSTIGYNPDVPDGPYFDKNGNKVDLPQSALLGHEMIHSVHNDQGTNKRDNVGPPAAEAGSNEEESQTIGILGHKDDPMTQNQILNDLGSPYRRPDHDSTVVPAPAK
ncbi:MAG: M91 family zinc metallopeptidase, partial [Pyrinomonadaceae bacterium]